MKIQSYRARWILPVEGPPIANGEISVVEGRIVALGQARGSAPVGARDLGDVVLLPGLINAHTHLEFSDCDRPLGAPGMPLPDWIRLVIGKRRQAASDSAEAIGRGLVESYRAGVTTLADISTNSRRSYLDHPLARLQIYHEVIGFSRARADSVFQDLLERMELQQRDCPFESGVSPHAPYTVSWQLLERLVEQARHHSLPVAMHLAESLEELQLVTEGQGPFRQLLEDRSMWDETAIPAGTTMLDYLRLLQTVRRALVIHGNYFQGTEWDLLAGNRDHMAVVYCPRTHGYFGHQPYPLPEMLARGVRVVLGTDSRASSPDLSLLAEIRRVAAVHPEIHPEQILKMATLEAAAALGLDEEIGSLRPGKAADLIALPIENEDPLAAVVHGATTPRYVYVRGRLASDSTERDA